MIGFRNKFFVDFLMPQDWADKKAEGVAIIKDTLTQFLALHGDFKYAVANEPTFADFVVYEILHTIRLYDMATFNEFPKIREYWSALCNMENMSKYISKEARTLLLPPGYCPFVDSQIAARPTLAYWPIRGRASASRLLMTHLGVDFNDKRYGTPEEWGDAKPNLDMSFPNLPYYFDGSIHMSESMAIVRQICRKYCPEYIGRTLKEMAQADQLVNVLADEQNKFYMNYLSPEDWSSKRAEAVEAIKAVVNQFLALRGDYKFAVGNEPTFVDFVAYEFFYIIRLYDMATFTVFPKLVEYFANVSNLPGVYEYE
jgi:glutathione S-transferase